MAYGFRLIGTSNSGEVDSAGQQRVILYDTAGNVLNPVNRASVAETAGGTILSGKNYKVAQTIRASSVGSLMIGGDETILLSDSFEGTTRNLNQWVETTATMVSAQTTTTGEALNSGLSVTTAQGILESSHMQFPLSARVGLLYRGRHRLVGASNCFEELGFSDQSSATTAVMTNGAFFRRDGAGSLQPILAFNGTEGAGATMTAPATTDYAWYEIFLEDDRATFAIYSATGALISSAVMERGATGGSGTGLTTQARLFTVTHMSAFRRVYNSGAAGTPPQIFTTHATVVLLDAWSQRSHYDAMSGMGYNALTSPTTFLQLANYANSAAPASATLSNTAAGYNTLGGQWQFAAVAGAETDYALFGFTNPTPYTLYVTSVQIAAWIQAIAVATTATVLQWGIAANSSAVSLATAAPYTPMRKSIGAMSAVIGTPPGGMFDNGVLNYSPRVPDVVQPGRFFHIILKIPIGTATASQIIRGTAMVDGYFQ
jgi:hypothetical protein